MIVDNIKNIDFYRQNSFYKYLKLITQTNWNTTEGKTILSEDAFFSVDNVVTKPSNEGFWESHRKYFDIHYIVKGVEIIGYSHREDLSIKEAYNEKKDLIIYHGGLKNYVEMHEGMFMIVFPQDAHMPNIALNNKSDNLKKVVFKICV